MSAESYSYMKKENAPIDFLAIGHVTHDLVDGRIRLGGAALYSCMTALRLGKSVGIFTSYGEDYVGKGVLDGIASQVVEGSKTSTFRNLYLNRQRIQHVYGIAEYLRPETVPSLWRKARIVYVCPVLHEVTLETATLFQGCITGIAPQGWFRTWNENGQIHPCRWDGFERYLQHATMVIVSENDIAGSEDVISLFRSMVRIVIVTRAERGAVVYAPDKTFDLGAYPADEFEPTGAGDCFGASFLIRYQETGDIEEAARFASCVGSFVVEKEGIEGIPERRDVLARMESNAISLTIQEKLP